MKEKETNSMERQLKVCLWVTLLFYWISGVLLICLGVSVQMKLHDTLLVLNEATLGIPMIVTVVGALLFIMSAFGAIALLKLNLNMIKIFTGLLLVILLVEIIVAVSAFSYRKKLHQTLLNDFLNSMDEYSKELQITKGVDDLQRQFQCCGAENYTDWLNITFGYLSSVPMSCCKVPIESCDADFSGDIHQQGCVAKLKNWVEENMDIFGGIGIFICFTQVIGILLCGLLLKTLAENYTTLE